MTAAEVATTPVVAISARGLRKSFGAKTVLDGIDLTVPEGTILALLGPNGAGKTTAVHLLTTYLRPDAGEILISGEDPARNPQAVRRSIGVTGQFSAVDGYLTGRENLRLMADLHLLPKAAGRRRAQELLDRFELTEAADKPASTYSGGMKRKLDLAMTLVGNPKVIFLDEPTTGLDPRSRRTMWDIIRGLATAGTTILLTTQYLDEADQLAHRVAVLDGGRIVAEGTPAELKARVPGGHIELAFAGRAQLDAAALVLGQASRDDDALTLQLAADGRVSTLRTLLRQLDDASVEVEALTVHTPDLDDVFFALTGKKGA
jgi:ABC-2 type transport system ATP-binding protein